MTTVKLSSKNQVVVPKGAREELHLKPGDELLAAWRGNVLLLTPKPKDIVAALAGSAKGIYGDVDEYLREERASWERRDYRKR